MTTNAIDRRTVLKPGAAFAAAGAAPCFAEGAAAAPVPRAAPSKASPLRAALARHVDSGYVPGAVGIVWQRAEAEIVALGHQAIGGAPMQPDTIFRIASITKPVTAAAAMILVEEGKLGLDDPVDEFLPELANPRVLRSIDAPLDDTVPAKRPITLRDLLTLRFGLGAIMIFPPEHPIQFAMAEAGVAPGPELYSGTPDEFMRALGALPLAAQPGEAWLYHTGMDVAGVLVARAAGQLLGEFSAERIFEPLGMQDTGFYVPEGKLDRFAALYRHDQEAGELVVFDEPHGRFSRRPAFESGGGGHVSTAGDYLKFCRMLLGKGEVDGARVLSAGSVEEMTRDQLTPEQRKTPHTTIFFADHSSWGLGMAVAIRRERPWQTPGRFGCDGGYGTSAYTDPQNRLIGVLMTQRLMDSPEPPPTYVNFWTAAYRNIDS